MLELDGRRALVTGASRGIGRALALALAAEGMRVIAVARDRELLAELAAEAGGGVTELACDVATDAGRKALAAGVEAAGEPLDLLVNNAGIQLALDIAGMPPEETVPAMEREIAVNLVAPAALTAQLLAHMRRPGGTIVNVTSLLALHPKASAPTYCASKAGLSSFTRAMRAQLEPLGVRVVEVMPPLVDTGMTAGRRRAKMSPQAMADAIVSGVRSGRQRVAPGLAGLMIGLDRLAPGLAARMLGKG